MHLRYRTVLPLVAVCLALAVAPAFAAKPAPTTIPLPEGSSIPDAAITAAPCVVGQSGAPAFTAQFIFPPDDEYYTLLDPANCGACAGGTYVLNTAHMMLSWPTDCTIDVLVSIVGATGTATCPVPDPTNVICPPTLYTISGTAAGGGLFTHDFPLAGHCCISGPAFLVIKFPNDGTCTPSASGLNAPRLVGDASCEACVSYNFYPGDPNFRDLCTFWGFPGNPIMYADADCCGATPTLPSTWGKMKTLYR